MNKQQMLKLLEVISSTDDMLKFFKVLVITIVQWPIELGPFLPGFIAWIKDDTEKKAYPPIVWLYGYIIEHGKKVEGEPNEANSK